MKSKSEHDALKFDLGYLNPEAAANPQPIYRDMQQRCPVHRMLPGGGHFVFRYDDVMFALRNPQIYSAEVDPGLIGNQRKLIPLQIDPPRQTKYRKLLDPLFLNKRMKLLDPDMRKLAIELIEAFADRGECEFSRDFAIPFPCTVFLRLMGLPQEDTPLFLELKDGIIRPATTDPTEAARIREESGNRVYAYFEEFLDKVEKSPSDDLLSHFLAAEVDGAKLTREEILDICFLFLIAGLDTVTATLGCSFVYLAEHPEERRRLIDDPSLLDSTVEELLRWETPVQQIIRRVAQDTTLGGVELKEGEMVTLVLGSANVDPDFFERAEDVDFGRASNRHIAFGAGAHRCLGSHLARLELRIALEEFHKRIPEYRIKEGETPVYRPAIREVAYLPLSFG